MENQNNILDVISGNKPLKFEIGLDLKSAAILGVVLFVSILGALFIYKKL
jgi:hypothetical protein